MDDGILFRVTDPLGYSVSLSSERYRHVFEERKHTEISSQNIAKTIENPDLIFKGSIQDTRVYFAKGNSDYPQMYTFVAVAEYVDEGDVRTAYLRKDVGGQIIPASNGGCIYINVNNKLR